MIVVPLLWESPIAAQGATETSSASLFQRALPSSDLEGKGN